MSLAGRLIIALWIVLIAFWGLSALTAKRNVGRTSWRSRIGVRLGVIVFVVGALQIPAVRRAVRVEQAHAAASMLMGLFGVACCALGVGLAIWARVYIGRNWGMPMSRKEDPELVTSGPYGFVRHPIYTGIILAMLGSAIGQSVFWVLPLAAFGTYFLYSARREERLMLEQFPDRYPEYVAHTKMLLPFVI